MIAALGLLGPYFPPDTGGEVDPSSAPTVWPDQPGIILLLAAAGVLVVLAARELIARYRRRGGGERIADELTIEWLPAEVAEAARSAHQEELIFGPEPRGRRQPGRQRSAVQPRP